MKSVLCLIGVLYFAGHSDANNNSDGGGNDLASGSGDAPVITGGQLEDATGFPDDVNLLWQANEESENPLYVFITAKTGWGDAGTNTPIFIEFFHRFPKFPTPSTKERYRRANQNRVDHEPAGFGGQRFGVARNGTKSGQTTPKIRRNLLSGPSSSAFLGGVWSEPEVFSEAGADAGSNITRVFASGVGAYAFRFILGNLSMGIPNDAHDNWWYYELQADKKVTYSSAQKLILDRTNTRSPAYFVPVARTNYIASERTSQFAWDEAQQFCNSRGGYIPWAEDEREEFFIRHSGFEKWGEHRETFIGCSDAAKANHWYDSLGRFCNERAYTLWRGAYNSTADHDSGADAEDYNCIVRLVSGEFSRVDCKSKTANVICELPRSSVAYEAAIAVAAVATSNDCFDDDTDCPLWASEGKCDNVNFEDCVRQTCGKSCGVCADIVVDGGPLLGAGTIVGLCFLVLALGLCSRLAYTKGSHYFQVLKELSAGEDDDDAAVAANGQADGIDEEEFEISQAEVLPFDLQPAGAVLYLPGATQKTSHLQQANRDSRVLLSQIVGDEPTYINANYIRGYAGDPNTYIAAQGPLPTTTAAFWRMIWEQNVKAIITFANLEGDGDDKCARYWPKGEGTSTNYADIEVKLESVAAYHNGAYVHSKLSALGNSAANAEGTSGGTLAREVHHFQYTRQPKDHTEPSQLAGCLDMLLAVRDYSGGGMDEPLLVHCRDGIGQTGWIIGVDRGMRELDLADTWTRGTDVANIIQSMRSDRDGMIHTWDEANLMHKTIVAYAAQLNGEEDVADADHQVDGSNSPQSKRTAGGKSTGQEKGGRRQKKKKSQLGIFVRSAAEKKKRSPPEELAKNILLGSADEPTDLSQWDEVKLVDLTRSLPEKHVANNAYGTQLMYKGGPICPVAPTSFSLCSWTSVNDDEIVLATIDAFKNNFDVDVQSKVVMLAFSTGGPGNKRQGGKYVPYEDLATHYASSFAAKAFDAGATGVVMVSPVEDPTHSLIRKSCKHKELASLAFKSPLLCLMTMDVEKEDELNVGEEEHNEGEDKDEDKDETENGGPRGASAPNAVPTKQSTDSSIWLGADECHLSMLSQRMEDWSFDFGQNNGEIAVVKWKEKTRAAAYSEKAVVIQVDGVSNFQKCEQIARSIVNPACIIFLLEENAPPPSFQKTGERLPVPVVVVQPAVNDRNTQVIKPFKEQCIVPGCSVKLIGNANHVNIPVLFADRYESGKKDSRIADVIQDQDPWTINLARGENNADTIKFSAEDEEAHEFSMYEKVPILCKNERAEEVFRSIATSDLEDVSEGANIAGCSGDPGIAFEIDDDAPDTQKLYILNVFERKDSGGSSEGDAGAEDGGPSKRRGLSGAIASKIDSVMATQCPKAVVLAFRKKGAGKGNDNKDVKLFEEFLCQNPGYASKVPLLLVSQIGHNKMLNFRKQAVNITEPVLPSAVVIDIEATTQEGTDDGDIFGGNAGADPDADPDANPDADADAADEADRTSDAENDAQENDVELQSEARVETTTRPDVLSFELSASIQPDISRRPVCSVKGAPSYYLKGGTMIPAERLEPVDEILLRTNGDVDDGFNFQATTMGPAKWNLSRSNPNPNSNGRGIAQLNMACGERVATIQLSGGSGNQDAAKDGAFIFPFSQPEKEDHNLSGSLIHVVHGYESLSKVKGRVYGKVVILRLQVGNEGNNHSIYTYCHEFGNEGAKAVIVCVPTRERVQHKHLYSNRDRSRATHTSEPGEIDGILPLLLPCMWVVQNGSSSIVQQLYEKHNYAALLKRESWKTEERMLRDLKFIPATSRLTLPKHDPTFGLTLRPRVDGRAGLEVEDVARNSHAYNAHIRKSAIITNVNGLDVSASTNKEEVMQLLGLKDIVTISFIPKKQGKINKSKVGVGVDFGWTIEAASSTHKTGLKVKTVTKGGAAKRIGLCPGCIVETVNNVSVAGMKIAQIRKGFRKDKDYKMVYRTAFDQPATAVFTVDVGLTFEGSRAATGTVPCGLKVAVASGSSKEAGLRPRDTITHLNGVDIQAMKSDEAEALFKVSIASGSDTTLNYQASAYEYRQYDNCLAVWNEAGIPNQMGKVKWIGYNDIYNQVLLEEYAQKLKRLQEEAAAGGGSDGSDDERSQKDRTTERKFWKKRKRRTSVRKQSVSKQETDLDERDMLNLSRLSTVSKSARSQKNEILWVVLERLKPGRSVKGTDELDGWYPKTGFDLADHLVHQHYNHPPFFFAADQSAEYAMIMYDKLNFQVNAAGTGYAKSSGVDVDDAAGCCERQIHISVVPDVRERKICFMDPFALHTSDLQGIVDRVKEVQDAGGAAVVFPYSSGHKELSMISTKADPEIKTKAVLLAKGLIKIPVVLLNDERSSDVSEFAEKFGDSVLKNSDVSAAILNDDTHPFEIFSGEIVSVDQDVRFTKNEMIFWVIWIIITCGGLAGILFGIIENSRILIQDYPSRSPMGYLNDDQGLFGWYWGLDRDQGWGDRKTVNYDDPNWKSGAQRASEVVSFFASDNKTSLPQQCDGPGARTPGFECTPPARTCCDGVNELGSCSSLLTTQLMFSCCPADPSLLARDQIAMIAAVIFSGAIALITNAMQLWYMKYSTGANYWATVGWWQKLKRSVTPKIMQEILSGTGSPSFRYLLKVSLKAESRATKKAAKKEAKQAAADLKQAAKEAKDKADKELEVAKTALKAAIANVKQEQSTFDERSKDQGRHATDKTALDVAKNVEVDAKSTFTSRQAALAQVKEDYASTSADGGVSAGEVDSLENAETWDVLEQFRPVNVDLEEYPNVNQKMMLQTPAFRCSDYIYYVLDPLEQRHGDDVDGPFHNPTSIASSGVPSKQYQKGTDEYDKYKRPFWPTIQNKHISKIAAHHNVSVESECEVILQELSQRPKTSLLFEFLTRFGLLVSTALLIFVQGFTVTKPEIECYPCGPQRDLYLAMRAAQSAGAGGLQIALFAAVGNQFGAGAVTEELLDPKADGNSSAARERREAGEVCLHTDKEEEREYEKLKAVPSWFGPRTYNPIPHKRAVFCTFDIVTKLFAIENQLAPSNDIINDSDDALLVCTLATTNPAGLPKELGWHFYYVVQIISVMSEMTGLGPLGIIFVQPPKFEKKDDVGGENGKTDTPQKLPNEFAREKRVRMQINQDGDDATIPAVMISAIDAARIHSFAEPRYLSLSFEPTEPNPPKAETKVELTRIPTPTIPFVEAPVETPVETPVEMPVEAPVEKGAERVQTPLMRRLSGAELSHAYDNRILFECSTTDVVFNFKVRRYDAQNEEWQATHITTTGTVKVPNLINTSTPGTTEITCFASRVNWYDSQVVRCTFDSWRSASPLCFMKPRLIAKRLFHQNPNEVTFDSFPSIDNDFVYGSSFVEDQEGNVGVKGLYDAISRADAVETGAYTAEQQCVYVAYKLGIPDEAPLNLIKLVKLHDKFNTMSKTAANVQKATLALADAVKLVNSASGKQDRNQLAKLAKERAPTGAAGEQPQCCSFVVAMFEHITYGNALKLGVRKFNDLGSKFEFSTTPNDFADDLDSFLRLHESVRAILASVGTSKTPTMQVYSTKEAARDAELALPEPATRALPPIPQEILGKIETEFAGDSTDISKILPGLPELAVGVFYTVDIDLKPAEDSSAPAVPAEVYTAGVASRADWNQHWQQGWGANTIPSLDLVAPLQSTQLYYSSNRIEESMVPLISRVHPAVYTFTAISVVDGLAASFPVTTTLSVTGGEIMTMKERQAKLKLEEAERKRAHAERDSEVEEEEGGVAGFGSDASEREDTDEDEDEHIAGFGSNSDDVSDDEEVTGFGGMPVDQDVALFLELDEGLQDSGGGGKRQRGAKTASKKVEEALDSAWNQEQRRLEKKGVPQSQQYLRKVKFRRASLQSTNLDEAPVDNAIKTLQEDNVVTQSRSTQARMLWSKVNDEFIAPMRARAEERRKEIIEEQQLAQEKMLKELREAEQKMREEEEETKRKAQLKEQRLRDQKAREIEAFRQGSMFKLLD